MTAPGMVLAVVLLGSLVSPAMAQLVLPGAVAPTPAGSTASAPRPPPKGGPAAAHAGKGESEVKGERLAKGVPVAVPGIAGLAGRTLVRNGLGSQISFAAGKPVTVVKLALAGDKITAPHDACRLDVAAASLAVTPLGKPNGVERYRVEFPACPIMFDVLAGAIVVDSAQNSCAFQEADCQVAPAGVWGPLPGDLGPDRVKSLEHERAGAEAAVRGNYKALTVGNKDRQAVKGFAHDQAQFSSSREEVCRDYAEEGRHGFCSTKITEARAALLRVEVDAANEAKLARKAARDAARHRPAK